MNLRDRYVILQRSMCVTIVCLFFPTFLVPFPSSTTPSCVGVRLDWLSFIVVSFLLSSPPFPSLLHSSAVRRRLWLWVRMTSSRTWTPSKPSSPWMTWTQSVRAYATQTTLHSIHLFSSTALLYHAALHCRGKDRGEESHALLGALLHSIPSSLHDTSRRGQRSLSPNLFAHIQWVTFISCFRFFSLRSQHWHDGGRRWRRLIWSRV